jgi:hypothetical protein
LLKREGEDLVQASEIAADHAALQETGHWKRTSFSTGPAMPMATRSSHEGHVWRSWGIDCYDAKDGCNERGFYVTHLPSGHLLGRTTFERFNHARLWCEVMDGLTDWSLETPAIDDSLRQKGRELKRLITGVDEPGAGPDRSLFDDLDDGIPF